MRKHELLIEDLKSLGFKDIVSEHLDYEWDTWKVEAVTKDDAWDIAAYFNYPDKKFHITLKPWLKKILNSTWEEKYIRYDPFSNEDLVEYAINCFEREKRNLDKRIEMYKRIPKEILTIIEKYKLSFCPW